MATKRPPQQESIPLGELERLLAGIGRRLGEQIGEAIVEGLKASLERSRADLTLPEPPTRRRGAGRERAAPIEPARCIAPACLRPALAKGLCATHYRKLRRLGLSDPTDPDQMQALATDGRKVRSRGG